MAIPLPGAIDIEGKDITADALPTRRELARYLVEDRQAHYYFTVKGNRPRLLDDLTLHFQDRREPEVVTVNGEHGRIETRKLWTTTALSGYLDFPHVEQAYVIERDTVIKKTGQRSRETAYGITSRPQKQAGPRRVLQVNRGHWSIENSCHYILDWNYDEACPELAEGTAAASAPAMARRTSPDCDASPSA